MEIGIINKKIQSWFKSNLGDIPSDSEDYFSSGLVDSFEIINLVLFCEKEFSIKFTEEDYQKSEFRSINGLTNIIYNIV